MKAATTREHGLTDGVGGRLWAITLCPDHNGLVNSRADDHFNKTFAPYVTMLQIPRQRGGVGAEFTAHDDAGNKVTIVREGFAKQRPLDVRRVDAKGLILHAVGDLDRLDNLPAERMSPEGTNVVLAFVENPTVNVMIASDGAMEGPILKIALNLYAGFVGDVPLDVATELLPYIIGDKVAGGTYVRTPFLHDDVFSDSWPARHEITFYPDGDHTLVTVMLFSAYAYTVRLPLLMDGESGFRYTQVLDENFPRVRDDVPRPKNLDWEDRPGLYDKDAYFGPIRERTKRLHQHGAEQSIRVRCKRAAERAADLPSNYGDLFERYKAALALECFDNADITVMVAIAKRLQAEGKPIWEVPVRIGVESQV